MKLLFRLSRRCRSSVARLKPKYSLETFRNRDVMKHFLTLSGALLSLMASSVLAGDVTDCSEDAFLAAFDGDPVTFNEDCSITLSTPVTIDSDTTIDAQGHKVTISGDNQLLVFDVASGVTFNVFGLTISSGQNTNGGALYINEGATVVLSNCTFTGNNAIGADGFDGTNGLSNSNGKGGNGRPGAAGVAGSGGAIFNLGDLTLLNSTLATNRAAGGKGGNGGDGGNAAGSYVGGDGAAGAAGMA